MGGVVVVYSECYEIPLKTLTITAVSLTDIIVVNLILNESENLKSS